MNLFEKQNKPFAIKLSDRVKEEVKKTFEVDYTIDNFVYFIYEDNTRFNFCIIEPNYTLITEAEFFGDGNNKLMEKFENLTFDIIHTDCEGDIAIASGKCTKNNAITLEQITDDFAVKFAEWLRQEEIKSSTFEDGIGDKSKKLTTTELLQIFKNNHYEK